MRILISEDSQTCRMILTRTLKADGHEVLETVDGQEAWDELQKPGAPQLVILDWVMPKMDGLELLARIRARPSQRPPYIIMLTGKGGTKDIIAGLDAGANDYLAKPWDPRELRARVEVGHRMIELQDALIESREKLAYQATHDPLTGISNRRAILDRLEEEFGCAGRRDFLAVGMCDVDHFKVVNDTYGHQTGDELLCGLTKILKESINESDLIGRIGGEEFLIIASAKTRADVIAMFERCCRQVAKAKIPTMSGMLPITVSIGVAHCADKDSVTELLAAADAALYTAKHQGRNRVSCDMAV